MSENDITSVNNQCQVLQDNNEYMKLMIDSTRNIYMLLDMEANVLYCSDYILELLGIDDIGEIIGKSVINIRGIYDDKAYFDRSVERYKRLLSGESDFTEDDEIVWPTIGKRLFEISHRLVRSKDGDAQCIALIMRDVTDERIMEEDIRMKERLHATQMPCFIWDEKGNVIDCNNEALSFFGYVGDPPDNFDMMILDTHPQYQSNGRITEDIRRAFVNETLRKGYSQANIQLQKVDGTPLTVEAMGVRVSWRYENRIFAYFHDLTELKAKENEAKEAEESLRIMFDSSPLMCIMRDENFEVIDCNPVALKIFGVPNKEDLIRNFSMFYPEYQPDGRKSSEGYVEIFQNLQNLEENQSIKFEWTFQTIDAKPLPVETTLLLISWKGVSRVLSYSRDLREEKAKEQKIQESLAQSRSLEIQKEKAKAASEAKSQFLASMSHEIRTPMNTIIGLLELMHTDNLNAVQKSYIKDIKDVSAVLLQIINDILDFHKIEAGKLELLYIHFNLNTLFNQLVSRHKFLAESKNLIFKSSLSPDLPRTLYGDELRITQIISNLLSNAMKYTRKGFVGLNVNKAVENDQEFVTFTVEDSGIGIMEENFQSIFEEFEQFDSQKNRGITGTGLGLSIVKLLCDMMDGQIRFKSEYGKGSEFTFYLPLISGDITKVEQESSVERVIAKADTKVLAVDDNSGNITVIIGLLGRHGIVPQTASNGVEAIEMIKANKYDLVFMDYMMPEMDGVEATKIIRMLNDDYYKKLPIIALSANAVAGAKELFFNSGMNDCVLKPINTGDLNRALIRWLPKEKIAEQASEMNIVEPVEDDVISDNLLEELIRIPDLSVSDGLALVSGNKKLYIDLLWQFCMNAEKEINALRLYAKKGHWRDYAVRIHGLKTVFANIGNQFMSDWAYSLELAAVRGNVDKCNNETNYFCVTMKKFLLELQQTELMKYFESLEHKEKITSEELKDALEQLLLACNNFQAEVAEPLAKELLNVTVNKRVDALLAKLHDSVHTFDYDETAEIIEKLKILIK
ncbi:MAG: ATP-binding protein [Synergistaceae bacterium]|nr:ATP-binding protein [Synergistaceae bacterium]